MDPIANIQEQRALARVINQAWDRCAADGTLTRGEYEEIAMQADRLADLVLALDEWQTRGGFSPYQKGETK